MFTILYNNTEVWSHSAKWFYWSHLGIFKWLQSPDSPWKELNSFSDIPAHVSGSCAECCPIVWSHQASLGVLCGGSSLPNMWEQRLKVPGPQFRISTHCPKASDRMKYLRIFLINKGKTCAHFGSTYTKTRMIQSRLAWPLRKKAKDLYIDCKMLLKKITEVFST